jgi:hypothetical protein
MNLNPIYVDIGSVRLFESVSSLTLNMDRIKLNIAPNVHYYSIMSTLTVIHALNK